MVKYPSENSDTVITTATAICLLVSTLLYIKWTSFGSNNQSEINKIENENQLLKKKIEQKELKAKLESTPIGDA